MAVTNGDIVMPNAAVNSAFTNTAATKAVSLTKIWVNALSGDGCADDQRGAGVSGSWLQHRAGYGDAGDGDGGGGFDGTPGGSTGYRHRGVYTTGLACSTTGGPVAVTNGDIVMPNAAVTCTFTNTAATKAVSLTKIWVNALSGDTAALTISGAQVSAVAGSSTAPGTVTPATATAAVGSTVHLAEVLGTGNRGVYTTGLACSTTGGPVAVTNGDIVMPNAAVTCTFTNTAHQGGEPDQDLGQCAER